MLLDTERAAERPTIITRITTLSDTDFELVKRQYASDSAQADRDGGDANARSSDYWDGWLDNMGRDEFIDELNTHLWGDELNAVTSHRDD